MAAAASAAHSPFVPADIAAAVAVEVGNFQVAAASRGRHRFGADHGQISAAAGENAVL